MRESEPGVEELNSWIRSHPETWGDAAPGLSISDDRLTRIAEQAISLATQRAGRRGRVRRRIVGAGIGGLCFVGGTVGVAAWLRSEPPTAPQIGVVCRAEPRVDADATVVEPKTDPIAACRALMQTETDGADDNLVACVGAGGAVEVFPGSDSTCAELGLVLADPEPTPYNLATIDLQERLVERINLEPCRPVSDVAALVKDILRDAGLEGWTVVVEPESVNGICGKADVDPVDRTVLVVDF